MQPLSIKSFGFGNFFHQSLHLVQKGNQERIRFVEKIKTFALSIFKSKNRQPLDSIHPKIDYNLSKRIDRAINRFIEEDSKFVPVRTFAQVVGNGLNSKYKNKATSLDGNYSGWSLIYAGQEMKRASLEGYGLLLEQGELKNFYEMSLEIEAATAISNSYSQITTRCADKNERRALTEELAINALHKVKNLLPGEKLLVPGGWTCEGMGHFALYEFEKTEDGRLLFNLFDTLFLDNHPSKKIGKKTKKMCALSWDLKTEKNDPLCHKDLLTELMSLKTNCSRASNQHPASYIHQVISSHFSKIGSTRLTCDKAWMTPQKSNVCSWQAIQAWKKHHLRESTYKKLTLCTKVRAFRLVKIREQNFRLLMPKSAYASSYLGHFIAESALKTKKQLRKAGLDENLLSCTDEIIRESQEVKQLENSQNIGSKNPSKSIISVDRPNRRVFSIFYDLLRRIQSLFSRVHRLCFSV